MSQPCREFAKSLDEKCRSKLTCASLRCGLSVSSIQRAWQLEVGQLAAAIECDWTSKVWWQQRKTDQSRLQLKRNWRQCYFPTPLVSLTRKLKKSRILPQRQTKSMFITVQSSTATTETTHRCYRLLSGNRIAVTSGIWHAVIAGSGYSIPVSQNKDERAFSAAGHVMTDLRMTLDPEHLDELLLIR